MRATLLFTALLLHSALPLAIAERPAYGIASSNTSMGGGGVLALRQSAIDGWVADASAFRTRADLDPPAVNAQPQQNDAPSRHAPNSAEGWLALGLSAAGSRRFEEAVDAFREALKILPEMDAARINLALSLLHLGRLDESRSEIARARTQPRDQATVWAAIGQAEAAAGRVERARDDYQRALNLDPLSTGARIGFGHVLIRTNRLEEAEAFLQQAPADLQGDQTALTLMSEIRRARFHSSGEMQSLIESIELAERAVKPDQRTAMQWRYLADLYFRGNAFKQAEYCYAWAAELDGKEVTDWAWLGYLRGVLRQEDAAETAFARAEALAPDNPVLLNHRLMYFSQRGKFEVALKLARRWAEVIPTDPLALNAVGYSLLLLGKSREAISTLGQVTAKWPGVVAGWINLGEAYLRVNDFQRAITALQRGLNLAPKSVDGRLFLAVALGSAKRADEARRVIEQLLTDAPDNVQAWLVSGKLALVRQDQAQVSKAYDELRKRDAASARELYSLVDSQWKTSRVRLSP
jgi:tetratricopeptide (TPR) repeat protein